MEQMITNIWNLNALLGGILVFLILVILCFFVLISMFLYPFRSKE
jgi:hypothetical protein